MDRKVKVQLLFNNVAVSAYFSTGLAISLIRESVAKSLKCVLQPVYGPDTEFDDPVTTCVCPILWETRLFINYGDSPTTATIYVVADEDIGMPLILGMDTLLALGMEMILNETSRMNPLYPIPGEEWRIMSTGLPFSVGSPEWFQKEETAVAIEYTGPPTVLDYLTRSTFYVLGKASYPLPGNPGFSVYISPIPTPLI